MTADVLVYARGGGFGHAMRGAEITHALTARGHSVTLLVEPESARHLGPLPRGVSLSHAPWSTLRRHRTLIVDTFPRGWRGEISLADFARFERTVLVSRYNRDPAFDGDAYQRVLNPYPADLDEWDTPPARSFHAGWVVREPRARVVPGGDRLVVFDPGTRMPQALADALARVARRFGLVLELVGAWRETLRAARLLCIGAGYNTVYELAREEADIRFVPLARRWDDQARRARRVGRAVESLDELVRWLAAPAQAAPVAGGGRWDGAALDAIWSAA